MGCRWCTMASQQTFPKCHHQVQLIFFPTNRSIQDADGEFMLIESALHIPDWLKPETAENRVGLRNGIS